MSLIKTKIAAVQMTTGVDIEKNIHTAHKLVAEAAEQGAELVVLPEVFACYDSQKYLAIGKKELTPDGLLRASMAKWAKEYQLTLVGGTIAVLDEQSQKVYPRTYVYGPNGEELGQYDKIHLFDVDVADGHGSYRESDMFKAGNEVVVVNTPVGNIGLTICYDLRFPYLYDRLRKEGADIIVVPAAFTEVTGKAHWHSLLRARAIETQCYIVAANQWGQHSQTRTTFGHSMVIDPWGEVLAELPEQEGVAIAATDPHKLQDIRLRMPLLSHQKVLNH